MEKLLHIDLTSDFLAMTPETEATSENRQVGLHQTKDLHRKGSNQQNKNEPAEWEKISENHVYEKE